MKMTGKGMSLPLDAFEIVCTTDGFVLGKISGKSHAFLKIWNLTAIFFLSAMKRIFVITEADFEDLSVEKDDIVKILCFLMRLRFNDMF